MLGHVRVDVMLHDRADVHFNDIVLEKCFVVIASIDKDRIGADHLGELELHTRNVPQDPLAGVFLQLQGPVPIAFPEVLRDRRVEGGKTGKCGKHEGEVTKPRGHSA